MDSSRNRAAHRAEEPPHRENCRRGRGYGRRYGPPIRKPVNYPSLCEQTCVSNTPPCSNRTPTTVTNNKQQTSEPRDVEKKLHIKNLRFTLKRPPKDSNFVSQKDVLYPKQWTKATADIVDVNNNPVTIPRETKITCTSNPPIEICNPLFKNKRLQFSLKASKVANAILTITFKRSPGIVSTITKNISVIYPPCSSSLSVITMKGIADDELVYRVYTVDVFGEQIMVNSSQISVQGTDITGHNIREQNTENNMYSIIDITVCGERLWRSDIGILLNGEKLATPEKFELSEEEQIVSGKNEDDNFCLFTLIPEYYDDGNFVVFDDDSCQIVPLVSARSSGNYKLLCKHNEWYDIIGAGGAHVNNIKRVLDIINNKRLPIEQTPEGTSITFDRRDLRSKDIHCCRRLVLHLLRGLYYREKASQCARARMGWKERFDNMNDNFRGLISPQRSPTLKFFNCLKDYYRDLMNRYNRDACEEIFKFFNYDRDGSEVDLHGLLVADEERLSLLKKRLLNGHPSDNMSGMREKYKPKRSKDRKKGSTKPKRDLTRGTLSFVEVNIFQRRGKKNNANSDVEYSSRRVYSTEEVNKLIQEWREESDEAIRMLKRTLEKFDLEKAKKNKAPWIEIIVGAGNNSIGNKQNIRPKVEKFLKERGKECPAVNKGSLLVTFIKYKGVEPCFGQYYCEQCRNSWTSSKSYIKRYQKCLECTHECLPLKQREKQKVTKYRRNGKEERRRSKKHQSHLCQRCQELGHPCNS